MRSDGFRRISNRGSAVVRTPLFRRGVRFFEKSRAEGSGDEIRMDEPSRPFYLDVTDKDGKVANWNLELASPNMLVRNGWRRTSLKEGDQVVVVASPAKDATNTASVETVTLPDGRKLTFMAAPDGPAK